MAQSRSAEDLLLLGQPQEALKTAREALKSSASSGLGAGAAAAAAVQAARALGNIDEAGKALHSAFGTNFASLPSEALVLWAEALEDAGRLEEAQEASDEALNRLGQMDRQLSRRAMRLSLVALAAEEGTVAAIDRSRKQLRMLDVHEEDRHALEQELDELESGLLEGFEESHAPEASANTGSNQKGGTSARGSNEMDWLRTLGQQQQSSGAQQGQQRAGAGSAGQQQGGARPVVLQQGTGGPQITLTPPDGNNQQQAAALQQLNQAAQQVRQQQQQHGQQQQQQSQQPQQQHSPTLPAGAKGVKQRIKEVDSTDNTSQQEQKQQQQQQQHHSQQQEPVNADDAKSKQSGWTKYLRRHSKQLKIIVGGALTVVALYSFMNRKAISRALSA